VKIAVTGGSGKAGRAIVRDLLEHGHEVLNIDRVPSAESFSPDTPAPFLAADLTLARRAPAFTWREILAA
jgi:nucleoside-diphosphate-sugar epimerase